MVALLNPLRYRLFLIYFCNINLYFFWMQFFQMLHKRHIGRVAVEVLDIGFVLDERVGCHFLLVKLKFWSEIKNVGLVYKGILSLILRLRLFN